MPPRILVSHEKVNQPSDFKQSGLSPKEIDFSSAASEFYEKSSDSTSHNYNKLILGNEKKSNTISTTSNKKHDKLSLSQRKGKIEIDYNPDEVKLSPQITKLISVNLKRITLDNIKVLNFSESIEEPPKECSDSYSSGNASCCVGNRCVSKPKYGYDIIGNVNESGNDNDEPTIIQTHDLLEQHLKYRLASIECAKQIFEEDAKYENPGIPQLSRTYAESNLCLNFNVYHDCDLNSNECYFNLDKLGKKPGELQFPTKITGLTKTIFLRITAHSTKFSAQLFNIDSTMEGYISAYIKELVSKGGKEDELKLTQEESDEFDKIMASGVNQYGFGKYYSKIWKLVYKIVPNYKKWYLKDGQLCASQCCVGSMIPSIPSKSLCSNSNVNISQSCIGPMTPAIPGPPHYCNSNIPTVSINDCYSSDGSYSHCDDDNEQILNNNAYINKTDILIKKAMIEWNRKNKGSFRPKLHFHKMSEIYYHDYNEFLLNPVFRRFLSPRQMSKIYNELWRKGTKYPSDCHEKKHENVKDSSEIFKLRYSNYPYDIILSPDDRYSKLLESSSFTFTRISFDNTKDYSRKCGNNSSHGKKANKLSKVTSSLINKGRTLTASDNKGNYAKLNIDANGKKEMQIKVANKPVKLPNSDILLVKYLKTVGHMETRDPTILACLYRVPHKASINIPNSSLFKVRAEEAEVLDIVEVIQEGNKLVRGRSFEEGAAPLKETDFIYRLGEHIKIKNYAHNDNECDHGIHGFIDESFALKYAGFNDFTDSDIFRMRIQELASGELPTTSKLSDKRDFNRRNPEERGSDWPADIGSKKSSGGSSSSISCCSGSGSPSGAGPAPARPRIPSPPPAYQSRADTDPDDNSSSEEKKKGKEPVKSDSSDSFSFSDDDMPELAAQPAPTVIRKRGSDKTFTCVFCIKNISNKEDKYTFKCNHHGHKECREGRACPLCNNKFKPKKGE